ncbi:MAG: hypothetical protein LBB56_01030 [Chitinispirillales bacterium]|nr:hypothetical protein [Chitinispirillales bacterium]
MVYEDEMQFRQFIEDTKTMKHFKKEMYFGMIPGELAERIKMDISCSNPDVKIEFDIKDYSCVLPSDTIRHTFGRHGDEEHERLYGQRAITAEDILMIPIVIQKYDSVELSFDSKTGAPALIFKKMFKGCTTVIAHVSSKIRMRLSVKSTWAGKNKTESTSAPMDDFASTTTSETDTGQLPVSET